MRRKIIYGLAAFMLLTGLPVLPTGSAFANWRGGMSDDVVEMYLEVGDYVNVYDVESAPEPDGDFTKVKHSTDNPEVISFDEDDDNGCFIRGEKVGKANATCEYVDEDGNEVSTLNILVHVFTDPNASDLDVAMMTGSTLNLGEVVAGYFDNPEEITPVVCGVDPDEGAAFTLEGTNVADTVIKAGDKIWADTICFYNTHANGYDEGAEALADSNDEFAQLFVSVFEAPELNDATLVADGAEEDKTATFVMTDEGNMPLEYEVVSSDTGVVSVAEDGEDDEGNAVYALTAQGTGEATITITYKTYGNPTQTFKVTVMGNDEDETYTEVESVVINESALESETVTDFENAKEDESHTIAGYYNVTLVVKDERTDQAIDTVEEASSAVKVTLNFPDGLPEVPEGYTRVYYVIRDHNGEKTILDAQDNGDGTFSFYSDKFSIYALAYYDVAVEPEEEANATATDATSSTSAPETGAFTGEAAGATDNQGSLVATIAVLTGLILAAGAAKYAKSRK